jgi:hypothetical protein
LAELIFWGFFGELILKTFPAELSELILAEHVCGIDFKEFPCGIDFWEASLAI